MGQGFTNTLPHKTSSSEIHSSVSVLGCLWCISNSFFTCICRQLPHLLWVRKIKRQSSSSLLTLCSILVSALWALGSYTCKDSIYPFNMSLLLVILSELANLTPFFRYGGLLGLPLSCSLTALDICQLICHESPASFHPAPQTRIPVRKALYANSI